MIRFNIIILYIFPELKALKLNVRHSEVLICRYRLLNMVLSITALQCYQTFILDNVLIEHVVVGSRYSQYSILQHWLQYSPGSLQRRANLPTIEISIHQNPPLYWLHHLRLWNKLPITKLYIYTIYTFSSQLVINQSINFNPPGQRRLMPITGLRV